MKSLEELRVIRERMQGTVAYRSEHESLEEAAASEHGKYLHSCAGMRRNRMYIIWQPRRSENVWMKRSGRTDWKRKYV